MDTEELYKKDLHDPDNHDGVITDTHLEPDLLECADTPGSPEGNTEGPGTASSEPPLPS